MTNNPPPANDPVTAMVEALDLTDMSARTTEDIFTGKTLPMPHGRIYGGQVLAQAIVAASRTLPDTRHVHSMHGYFLRAGDATNNVTLSVDRIHDGRSFSTRRVQAFQEGVPIFSMISSFQDETRGVEHQDINTGSHERSCLTCHIAIDTHGCCDDEATVSVNGGEPDEADAA